MNLLTTPPRRKLLFAALYASEGAPIGFLWWALPTRLKSADVPDGDIARLVALLALPWALKVLWAPLVDVLRGPRWGRRAWILSAQLCMGLTLLPLIRLDLHDDFSLIVVLLIMHALAAATQDVSIDSLAIAVTPRAERGAVNAWMQVGMLTARAVFAGGTLLLGTRFGDAAMIGALVGTIWFSSLLILGSKSEAPQAQAPPSLRVAAREFASALRAILRRRVTWMGLGLALLGGTAYEGVGAMLGPFLLSRGLSEQHVGAFYLAPAVAAAILGSLAGGRLADRLGRARAVSAGIIGCVLIVFTAAGTDLLLASAMPELRLTQFTLLYVAIGVLTAASYALFMDLTDPRLGATQFSAFMGATNLCEALSAAAVGQLIVVPQLGYPGAFAIVSAASLVCLPLLWRMSDLRRMDHVAGDGGSQSNNAAQR